MGLLLYLVALIIRPLILLSGILYGLGKCFHKSKVRNGIRYADKKLLTIAVSIDQYGNSVCQELFNDTLIQPNSKFPFGKIHMTISAVLGLNKRENSLTKAGRMVVSVLDFLDKNHCIKSIPPGM